ncbi:PPE domain-containing protein [Rhodococcus sp. (in: high G+C Gram-positive bacteria)]|uniref:WXG100 family type VII secretion target n=1 Tax=Rhodococcus sp. TaxID=1831 RepID=UPI003B8A5DD5
MGLPDFGGWVEGISKDIVEFGKHPANKVLDLVTGYDLNERSRVRDEQAAGNAERDEIYLQQAGLYGRFSGRFDDPALGSPEAFEAMSHEDIKAAVDGMNGGALRASAEGWTKIGQSLEQALNDFRDFIATETDGKWEGVAKDSATAATGRYATESGKLAEAGTLIGTKITEAATGVDQVKATVPPVSKRSLLEVAFDAGMPTAGLFKRLFHDQDEAHQEAIQIMRSVYTPVMQQADTNVPRLPEPPRVIAETQSASPSSGGAPGIGTPGSPTPYTGGPNSGSPIPPVQTPGSPIPGATPETGSTPGAFNPIAPGAQSTSNDQFTAPTDATTTPAAAWTAPAAAAGLDGTRAGQSAYGIPGMGGGAGTYSGAGGSGSNAGSGIGAGAGGGAGGYGGGILSGGYGSSGYGSGGMGSGGSGTGGTTGSSPSVTAGGTAGTTAAGTAARGGAATGGMMPGAGARGRGDDDAEHKTPGYLVNVDNGSELIGNLPLAAPPVIGS